MDNESDERRRYRRVGTQVHVSIRKYEPDQQGFSTDEGTSKNLSVGGLLLHHDKPVEVPSYIMISFLLPGSEEKLDFVGKVTRIEELMDGTYEIGVMFMHMILGDFGKLMKYISSEHNP